MAEAFAFIAVASGTARVMQLYLDSSSTASRVILGLYSDRAKKPYSRLASVTLTTPRAGAWNSFELSAGVNIVAGQRYWIAILAPVGYGLVKFRDLSHAKGTAIYLSSSSSLTSLPTTFSVGQAYQGWTLSAYIDTAIATSLSTVTVSCAPGSVAEDGAANLVYTFARTGDTSLPLTVTYAVSGSATSGTDYAAVGTSVTFAAGSSVATVTVNPAADATVESNETVTIALTGGGYTIGTPGSATGTISNDDAPPVTSPSVTLTVAPSSVPEDDAANLVYTFARTGDTTAPLTVNYSISGTAASGSDFPTMPPTVTFAAGSASTTVVINPTADTTVESNETVILSLASGTGYIIGTPATASGTISNDDATPPPAGLAFPSGWDDPIFAAAANTVYNSIQQPGSGSVFQDATIDKGKGASGSPYSCIDLFANPGQSITVNRVRMRGREGVRGASGNIYVNWTFIDIEGRYDSNATYNDHADGWQNYAPGEGPDTTCYIKNTHVRLALNGTENAAIWSANNFMGNIVLENVYLHGGLFALRVPGDGATNLSVKNLYIEQNSYRWEPIRFDYATNRHVNILQWENVWLVNLSGTTMNLVQQLTNPNDFKT